MDVQAWGKWGGVGWVHGAEVSVKGCHTRTGAGVVGVVVTTAVLVVVTVVSLDPGLTTKKPTTTATVAARSSARLRWPSLIALP